MKSCFSLTHLFPWSRTAGTKTSLLCVAEGGFSSFSSRLWQTDQQTDRYNQTYRQTESGRADLKTEVTGCLTVDINLFLFKTWPPLNVCHVLHNRLCQPKGGGTSVSVVCETHECKHAAVLMGKYPFRAKACPLEDILTETLSWCFAISLNPAVLIPPPQTPLARLDLERKRLQLWDSWRVTKWANKIC